MKSDNVYDILKVVALVILPALATLVSTVFEIWGLPYGAAIAGTITAIGTCLGGILLKASALYKEKKEKEAEEGVEDA